MTDTTPPAVWVDGDPLMEAVAAAVWEHCGRSDSGTCVEDDPRNIAAAAAAVARTLAASAVVPAADRAALRDRIAAAVQPLLMDTLPKPIAAVRADEVADAVLSVLPAPADRAAVLEEAAAAVAALDRRKTTIFADTIRDAWEEGRDDSAEAIRLLAAEAAAVPAVGVAADTTPAETLAGWHRTGGFDQHDDYRTAEPGPVVPAQPGGDALPCGHRPDYCWGCPGGCEHCRCHADERNG